MTFNVQANNFKHSNDGHCEGKLHMYVKFAFYLPILLMIPMTNIDVMAAPYQQSLGKQSANNVSTTLFQLTLLQLFQLTLLQLFQLNLLQLFQLSLLQLCQQQVLKVVMVITWN